MSVEQPQEDALHLYEKAKLFIRVGEEVAERLKSKDGTEVERAHELLRERWRTARSHYRSAFMSLSIPDRAAFKAFNGSVNSKEYAKALSESQTKNAMRVADLWRELESYFRWGRFYGPNAEEDAKLSAETAKELVRFLAKDQQYR